MYAYYCYYCWTIMFLYKWIIILTGCATSESSLSRDGITGINTEVMKIWDSPPPPPPPPPNQLILFPLKTVHVSIFVILKCLKVSFKKFRAFNASTNYLNYSIDYKLLTDLTFSIHVIHTIFSPPPPSKKSCINPCIL